MPRILRNHKRTKAKWLGKHYRLQSAAQSMSTPQPPPPCPQCSKTDQWESVAPPNQSAQMRCKYCTYMLSVTTYMSLKKGSPTMQKVSPLRIVWHVSV